MKHIISFLAFAFLALAAAGAPQATEQVVQGNQAQAPGLYKRAQCPDVGVWAIVTNYGSVMLEWNSTQLAQHQAFEGVMPKGDVTGLEGNVTGIYMSRMGDSPLHLVLCMLLDNGGVQWLDLFSELTQPIEELRYTASPAIYTDDITVTHFAEERNNGFTTKICGKQQNGTPATAALEPSPATGCYQWMVGNRLHSLLLTPDGKIAHLNDGGETLAAGTFSHNPLFDSDALVTTYYRLTDAYSGEFRVDLDKQASRATIIPLTPCTQLGFTEDMTVSWSPQ